MAIRIILLTEQKKTQTKQIGWCTVLYPYLILHSLSVSVTLRRFCQIIDDPQIHSNHRSKWKIIINKEYANCRSLWLSFQWLLTIADLPRKNSLIDIWIVLRFIVNFNNSYRYTNNSLLWLLLLYFFSHCCCWMNGAKRMHFIFGTHKEFRFQQMQTKQQPNSFIFERFALFSFLSLLCFAFLHISFAFRIQLNRIKWVMREMRDRRVWFFNTFERLCLCFYSSTSLFSSLLLFFLFFFRFIRRLHSINFYTHNKICGGAKCSGTIHICIHSITVHLSNFEQFC